MIRTTITILTFASILALGACAGESRSMSSNDGYMNRQGRMDRDSRGHSPRDGVGQGAQMNQANWGNQTWNDTDVVMINDSDLPSGARTCLTREAGGGMLTETGRGMWDGKQAYSGKVMKNGRPYKVITDADGNLIAMRRVD